MMYSSKTLTDRNNDPEPWLDGVGGRDNVRDPFAPGASQPAFAPRPEFQHGKLPANPILVHFRNYSPSVASLWVHRLGLGEPPVGIEATDADIAHAHRVLHLLTVVAS